MVEGLDWKEQHGAKLRQAGKKALLLRQTHLSVTTECESVCMTRNRKEVSQEIKELAEKSSLLHSYYHP